MIPMPGTVGRRPAISYWAMRYGDDMKTPTASIQGPKAMLIDETAGSGGDMLPWMFQNLKMVRETSSVDNCSDG